MIRNTCDKVLCYSLLRIGITEGYNRRIANWDTDPEILKEVVFGVQKHVQGKLLQDYRSLRG